MTKSGARQEELSRAIARIQTSALAIACALIGGLGLFIMTVWLLVKGGSEVGPHLHLLSQYFIGYSVTWIGSLIGFCYGALIGGLVGWAIGRLYNWIVSLRHSR